VTRTLVMGLGNPCLRDDAVGVRLASFVHERLGDRPGVRYVEECSAGGLEILERVAGHDRLVLLDSIRAGGPPGGWYRFDGGALRETMNLRNVHDTNLATALELGRRLGMRVPAEEEVHVFAVEVEDNLTFDERMSDALERRFPEFAPEICEEVGELLGTVPTIVYRNRFASRNDSASGRVGRRST
jgi:hydrogenase maturation protease